MCISNIHTDQYLGWIPRASLQPHLALHHAQSLFKKLGTQGSGQQTRLTVESGKYLFHYILDHGVCFLTLCERGYPKKLAFQYLEELTSEFSRLYGQQVDTITRPYAFIKFGKLPAACIAADMHCMMPGPQAWVYWPSAVPMAAEDGSVRYLAHLRLQ
jgi:hypothetical protein